MLDYIRILAQPGYPRDYGERELFLVDDADDHQFPPDCPGISGEWLGERTSDGRPVWVAAVWIDEPDGAVVFGVTYRLQ